MLDRTQVSKPQWAVQRPSKPDRGPKVISEYNTKTPGEVKILVIKIMSNKLTTIQGTWRWRMSRGHNPPCLDKEGNMEWGRLNCPGQVLKHSQLETTRWPTKGLVQIQPLIYIMKRNADSLITLPLLPKVMRLKWKEKENRESETPSNRV